MPIIFRYKGYIFFFFSNENMPREPIHVHVRKAEALAKFWIEPEVKIAEAYSFSSSELKELLEVIEQNKNLFIRSWHEHFGE